MASFLPGFRVKWPASLFFAGAIAWLAAGCAATSHGIEPNAQLPSPTTPPMEAQAIHLPPPDLAIQPYRIGAGDVLLVRDLDHPELFGDRTVYSASDLYRFEVMADGRIVLPMVQAVDAAGRTPAELQATLNENYARFVRQPNFSVAVAGYRSQRIYVLGQVQKPGIVPFEGRTTLLDAVGAAGGLTDLADLRSSHLVRGTEVLPVDFYALFREGDLRYNVPLRGGDVLTIRDRSDRRVYVLGEVRRPGAYPMTREPMRLVDAVSLAGGLDPVTAAKGNILLVRGDYANPTVYRISLGDVLDVTRLDTALEPGDRVLAMPTGLTNWNRIVLQLLPFLQAGQSASGIRQDYVE